MHVEELLKLAKKGKLDQLESAWVTAVGDDAAQLGELLEVPQALVDHGHHELAESLLWYLADSLKESGDLEGALASARHGGRLLPDSDVMRELLAQLYGETYSARDDAEELIRLTLGAPGLALDVGLAGLEKMLSLCPGAYVLDPQQGTVGRVKGLDAENRGLVVDFGDSQKVYGIALIRRLEPVDGNDFRALRVFEREGLEALAREDPERLVQMVLSSLDRRMELRRLKVHLEPVVGSWSKWWSAARQKLKRSAVIGMTEGRSPSLFLRRRPLSHGERLLQQFESIDDPVGKLSAALRILAEAEGGDGMEGEALQRVADEVARLVRQSAAESLPVALAGAAVADALRRRFPALTVSGVLPAERIAEALADPGAFAAALKVQDVLLCALDFIQRGAPQVWQGFFSALMPLLGRRACRAVARRLVATGNEAVLVEACRGILGRPERTPGSLAWLWTACTGAMAQKLGSPVDPAAVVMQLLSTAASLVRAADLTEDQRKEQINEIRSALFTRGAAPLREALQHAGPDQIAAIKGLGERNPALTSGMQVDLTNMLSSVRPPLSEKAVPPWQEDVIYTTAAGTERRRAELERIANVRLPQIMREIGQAASFGDVTDNAEYRAAIEERARLAERAARMQEELAQTRPITHEMAAADHVTVGSRVQARNEATGQVETLTFLGPWDARPEEKVYAYNAPLGLAFMGKRVGDTVTFQVGGEERRWEVLEVAPGG